MRYLIKPDKRRFFNRYCAIVETISRGNHKVTYFENDRVVAEYPCTNKAIAFQHAKLHTNPNHRCVTIELGE